MMVLGCDRSQWKGASPSKAQAGRGAPGCGFGCGCVVHLVVGVGVGVGVVVGVGLVVGLVVVVVVTGEDHICTTVMSETTAL